MTTQTNSSETPDNPEPSTVHRKFVRVTSPSDSEFVQFEFAIGWPDLSAELTLRRDQFEEFCKKHQVEFLNPHE
jgi:phenol/toluene 2-monooxygenase (NADH) P0/A0